MRLVICDQSGDPYRGQGHVVLREPDGTPTAFGWSEGQLHWIYIPAVGSFSFSSRQEAIVAFPAGDRESIKDSYRTAVLPLASQVLGQEALHASAVQTSAGIAAFCAMSGTGKSTIAYGLSLRGYELWGDDALIFEPQQGGMVMAFPAPFALNLRAESQAFFRCSAPHPIEEGSGEPRPLCSVVVLERVDFGLPVQVRQLPLGEAIQELLPHGYRFTLDDPDRKRKTMQSYLALASTIPVFKARFRAGFEHLSMLLDQIERSLPGTERSRTEPAA
jgi:hypothetical protein